MERPRIPLASREKAILPISEYGLNWICIGEACPTPCCGRFEGPSIMLRSVIGLEMDSIILLPDEEWWFLANFPDRVLHKGSLSQIKLKVDGSCPFFENGRCAIYEHRPHLCQAYPFYVDLCAGVCLDTRCPGIKQGWVSTNVAMAMVNSLAEIVQFHLSIVLDILGGSCTGLGQGTRTKIWRVTS